MQQFRHATAVTPSVPATIVDRATATKPRTSTQAEKFAERLTRLIHHRTHGAVRQLRVDISPQGIALSGRCRSFYLKQLAQEAVLAIIEDQPLANEIEVN